MTTSCLVAKLSHYIELTPAESGFLAAAEKDSIAYERGSTIASAGRSLDGIYVLKSGWLVAKSSEIDGGEMILEVHSPGDVVGTSQLGCQVSTLSYVAATDLQLCLLPKHSIPEMFDAFPRLTALFFAFCAFERASMVDRIRAMGRMSARDCVALFLLQVHARLALTGSVDPSTSRFSMPLTQELIGNTVGLSIVSVNRAIRLLEAEGHLVRDGRMMEFPRREALAREVDFIDRAYRIDGSWLPLGDHSRG